MKLQSQCHYMFIDRSNLYYRGLKSTGGGSRYSLEMVIIAAAQLVIAEATHTYLATTRSFHLRESSHLHSQPLQFPRQQWPPTILLQRADIPSPHPDSCLWLRLRSAPLEDITSATHVDIALYREGWLAAGPIVSLWGSHGLDPLQASHQVSSQSESQWSPM